MTNLSHESLVEHLSWRSATKSFDAAKKIPDATWRALEQSLILSPSSYGIQPWKFFVITDPGVRATLRSVAWNQTQITDASHLVVLARRSTLEPADIDRLINRIAEVRGVPAPSLDGYRSMMLGSVTGKDPAQLGNWNARQVYIALGFFLSACAVLGVDACPMEGFDAAKFDEILGLPAKGYNATVVAAAGYRAAADPYSKQAKVRFAYDQVVAHI
jgi:nitroreductase